MDLKSVNESAYFELHFLLGSALWQCQALEGTLCLFIVVSTHAPASLAQEEASDIMRELQKHTFGALLSKLKKGNTTNSVSSIQARFQKMVDERNWLAHRSWREHHTDLFNPEKLPQLFARIDAISSEAGLLNKFLVDASRAWIMEHGISAEEMDARTLEILRQRGAV